MIFLYGKDLEKMNFEIYQVAIFFSHPFMEPMP
jgi:hypothetical protein